MGVKKYTNGTFFFDNYTKGFLDDFFSLNLIKSDFYCDFYEKDKKYILELELPGYKKENIELSFEGKKLIIFAKLTKDKTESVIQNFIIKGRNNKTTTKTFVLPKKCKMESLDASYENGILKIEFDILQEKQGKIFKIK